MTQDEPQGPKKLFVETEEECTQIIGDEANPHAGVALFLYRVTRVLNAKTTLYVGRDGAVWQRAWQETGCGDFVAKPSVDSVSSNGRFDLIIHDDHTQGGDVERARNLVATLSRWGDRVCFLTMGPEAGTQDGSGFWRQRFFEKNWYMFDVIRSLVQGETSIVPEIRYGSFLFVRAQAVTDLPGPVFATAIRRDEVIEEMAPFSWRLRRRLRVLVRRPQSTP